MVEHTNEIRGYLKMNKKAGEDGMQ